MAFTITQSTFSKLCPVHGMVAHYKSNEKCARCHPKDISGMSQSADMEAVRKRRIIEEHQESMREKRQEAY